MTADLAILADAQQADVAADPAQYVTLACERAKVWLANALEHGDIEQIVELKSRAEAIRIYTQQKELGKDAELSAAEIVRRAERGIHLAVNAARARGELLRNGQTLRRPGHRVADDNSVKSLADFGLVKDDLATSAPLTDGVTDEQFEEALDEARQERNLSRANVTRKVRDIGSPMTRLQKAEKIRELAAQGCTTRQIAEQLTISLETVRVIRLDHDIDIPADRVVGRTRRIDPDRVVTQTVFALEGLRQGLGYLTPEDLDALNPDSIPGWRDSLSESVRSLRRLIKELDSRA